MDIRNNSAEVGIKTLTSCPGPTMELELKTSDGDLDENGISNTSDSHSKELL